MYISIQELCQNLKDLLQIKFNHLLPIHDFEYILKSEKVQFLVNNIKSEAQLNEKLIHLANAYMAGKPVQYIINEAVFMDLILFVDERVLIPRSETEELVHWIELDNKHENISKNVLDIGTGSGCIPIYLKRKFQNWTILGLDISKEALDVAKMNANKYETEIFWMHGDFLHENLNVLDKLDIIVSNPPYIPMSESFLMGSNVINYEPQSALFVDDEQPFLFYEKIISFSKDQMHKNGKIYCEMNEFRAIEINKLFIDAGFTTEIKEDLQGKSRMLKAWFSN